MGVDEKTEEFFKIESERGVVNGYYDMINNRIHLTDGYGNLEDGKRYKVVSRCGKEIQVEVDMNKRHMKVLGVYEQGKFIPKKRVDEPNHKRTLDLICFECD